MDGKKHKLFRLNVILPFRRHLPAESSSTPRASMSNVIELNEAARQRAAFKRLLRCHNLLPNQDMTVA